MSEQLACLAAGVHPDLLKAVNVMFPALKVQKNGLVERALCIGLNKIYEDGGAIAPADLSIAQKIIERYGPGEEIP